MQKIKMLLLASMVILFTACGGGSSSTETTEDNIVVNILPTANAGSDLNVELIQSSSTSTTYSNTSIEVEYQSVNISGTATDTDGVIVSYEWTNGTEVLATTASFDYIITEIGTETLTFTVMDDDGATASDSMNITVTESTDGGSSTTPTIPEVNPNGIWRGTNIVNGITYDIDFIIHNNKIGGYTSNLMFGGDATMENEQLSATYGIWSGEDQKTFVGQGYISGIVIEQYSIEGNHTNFSVLGDSSGTFSVSFDDLYNKPSSFSYIEGYYVTSTLDFNISSSGDINGSIGDCLVSGNIEIPDPLVNIYYVRYTLNSCSYAGDYFGIGTITYDSDDDIYVFVAGMGNSEAAHTAYVEVSKPSTF